MSLRDQLVAKGLVSKKDARRVERELKEERLAEQGSRQRKSVMEAEARARAQAEAEAKRAERQAERLEVEARREAAARAQRVKDLIDGSRLDPGGGQPFSHQSLDGERLLRMDVSSDTASQLQRGEVSIAGLEQPGGVAYAVIPREAALALQAFAPEHLVFHNHGPDGASSADRSD